MKDRFGNFIKNYSWLISICFGVLAIAFAFLPIISYEIREQVFNISTGDRISKLDYWYDHNLVSYFNTPYKLNFTIYITLGFIVLGIIFAALSKIKEDYLSIGGIMFLLGMCMFLLSKEFFKSGENYVEDYCNVVAKIDESTQRLTVELHDLKISWGGALGIAFTTIAFAFTTIPQSKSTTKEIAEEGVLLSLAFVLNFIKIPVGATGGSINFQMLPLMIIALRHGVAHGFIAGGIVYGLLTCLTDGYGFACYPFDYLIGFGSVAVMGLFRKYIFSEEQKTYNFKGLLFIFIGGLLSTLIRFIGSNVSSIVIYGYNLEAALAYNSFYIPLSGAIATIAFMALYAPLITINRLYPVPSQNKEASPASSN